MMKKLLFILFAPALIMLSCSSPNSGGDKKYDTTAVENLDSLSGTIGKLNSCSYTLKTIVTKTDGSENLHEYDVYMRGPDKMYIHSQGTKGQKDYWCERHPHWTSPYESQQFSLYKGGG